jgi:hypothetical protein
MKNLAVIFLIALFTVGCATRTKYVYVKAKPKKTEATTKHTGGPESDQNGEREGQSKQKQEDAPEDGAKASESTDTEDKPEVSEDESSTDNSESKEEELRKTVDDLKNDVDTLTKVVADKDTRQREVPERVAASYSGPRPYITTDDTVYTEAFGDVKLIGGDKCSRSPSYVCAEVNETCGPSDKNCREMGFRYTPMRGDVASIYVKTPKGPRKQICVRADSADRLYGKNIGKNECAQLHWMVKTMTCAPDVENCTERSERVYRVSKTTEFCNNRRDGMSPRYACDF